VDLTRIRRLIELAEETGLVELEVRTGDETIRFVRGGQPLPAAAAAGFSRVAGQHDATPAGEPVVAAMAGTFYAGSAPGATPFVEVGRQVAPGTVLGILESMKMLNDIVADRAGTITQVAVADGQPVGTGDLLFRIA